MAGGNASTETIRAAPGEMGPAGARIPLARDLSSRILAGIAAFFVSIPAVAMLVVAVALSDGSPIGAGFCAALGLGLTWLTGSIGRSAFHRGAWIDVGPDSMTVHHPIVFRRDLVVPRKQIRAAAASVYEDPGWWLDHQFDLVRERRGIAMHAGREELREVLEATARFTVPLVDENDQAAPNVIVVFHEPIRLSDVRRGLRTGASTTWAKRAERDQVARGLLFRTNDPVTARAAFDRWGIRNRLGSDDADILVPTKEDLRRWRRFKVVAIAGTVWGAAVVAARLYELFFD
jgi:hypothetical protein